MLVLALALVYWASAPHPAAAHAHAAGKLWMVGQWTATLLSLNGTSGAAERISAGSFTGSDERSIVGMAVNAESWGGDPAGTIYALGKDNQALYTVDPETNELSRPFPDLDDFGGTLTVAVASGMTFDHEGDMYIVTDDDLYSIDPTTGQGTHISDDGDWSVTYGGSTQGFKVSGLAAVGESLFLAGIASGSQVDRFLIRLDGNYDGAATLLHTDFHGSDGLTAVGNVLYGVNLGKLYSADSVSGDDKRIGTTTGFGVAENGPRALAYLSPSALDIPDEVRASPGPYGVQATVHLVEAATNQHEVQVEWETPSFTADDDTDWTYWLRLDGGAPFANTEGNEHSQEHDFYYTDPGLLDIEVRTNFHCAMPLGHCALIYSGQALEIPAGHTWTTVWSAPALADITAAGFQAGEAAVLADPDPAVVELIETGMSAIDMKDDPGLARTLAVLLCLTLATIAAASVTAKFGLTSPSVVVAALLWYIIFAGLGLQFFGVPQALVIVLVAVPFILAALTLIRRFA